MYIWVNCKRVKSQTQAGINRQKVMFYFSMFCLVLSAVSHQLSLFHTGTYPARSYCYRKDKGVLKQKLPVCAAWFAMCRYLQIWQILVDSFLCQRFLQTVIHISRGRTTDTDWCLCSSIVLSFTQYFDVRDIIYFIHISSFFFFSSETLLHLQRFCYISVTFASLKTLVLWLKHSLDSIPLLS